MTEPVSIDLRHAASLIKHVRCEANLSQTELARRIGLQSRANICNYESGRHEPTLRTLSKILDVMGYDVIVEIRKRE